MPPSEVWEKVLVDAEGLAADPHAEIECITCHAGQDVDGLDMDAKHAAHEGLIKYPSDNDPVSVCSECHEEIVAAQVNSLHNTMAGYDTVLYERALPENHSAIEDGQAMHCNSCHTSCGECHISQPANVGGGLVDGHVYNSTPSMSRQCTACHGSRIKNEYTGSHEDLLADAHLRSERMLCTDCHTGEELHGMNDTEEPVNHRYEGAQEPSCVSCHEDVAGKGNDFHEAHGTTTMSCQTCHSIAYMNCYDCHLNRTEDELSLPYFELQHEELGFFIGRNPRKSDERPYKYVPVRHVPTWPGLFDFYGENVLSEFGNLPTWTYATPHNIQLNTPQTKNCDSCHGNETYFLTEDKVLESEREQNAGIIVKSAPDYPEY